MKQEKLEIVLSLIGHVGSNPTISARSRRFKRICDFFILRFYCLERKSIGKNRAADVRSLLNSLQQEL